MNKLFAFVVALFCAGIAHAAAESNDWQFVSTGVAPTTAGTSYSVGFTLTPTSAFTTYTVYVLDSLRPWEGTTIFGSSTNSITMKDGSGNAVCNTPTGGSGSVSMSGVTGSITLYTWIITCSSGTLTNGNTYTITLTGKDYQVGSGSSGAADDIAFWVGAQ